jgi:hypothetical protein
MESRIGHEHDDSNGEEKRMQAIDATSTKHSGTAADKKRKDCLTKNCRAAVVLTAAASTGCLHHVGTTACTTAATSFQST